MTTRRTGGGRRARRTVVAPPPRAGLAPECRIELRGFSRNVDGRCWISGRVHDATVRRVAVLDEQGRRAADQVGDGVALLVSDGAF